MRKLIVSIAIATSLFSCQLDSIDCGVELLEIERKYSNSIEQANGDTEKIKDLYKQKLVELDATDCY